MKTEEVQKMSIDRRNNHSENMIELGFQRVLERMDDLHETVSTVKSDVHIINSKVDDFSSRLKKLEDRDEKIQQLANKLELILERLEPNVKVLDTKVQKLEERVATLENNWKWVCIITGLISGIVVWGIEAACHHIFFK